MNITSHTTFFEQEMLRRGFAKSTTENYSSCIKEFFGQSKADHPKNIHEAEIREYLGRFSEPNTQRSVHSAIKKFYEVCLIRHCTFTHMLENGVDLTIIQKVAGHSSIKTTQGYAHISNSLISKTFSPLKNISI